MIKRVQPYLNAMKTLWSRAAIAASLLSSSRVILPLLLVCSAGAQSLVDDFAPLVGPTLLPGNPLVFAVRSAMAIQPDGKILVSDDFSQMNSVAAPSFARLKPDGTTDTAFNLRYEPQVARQGLMYGWKSAAIHLDGSIMISGPFRRTSSNLASYIAKLLAKDGTSVSSFLRIELEHTDGATVWIVEPTVKPLASGSALVAGSFNRVNGSLRTMLIRQLPSGIADPTFTPTILGDPAPILNNEPLNQVSLALPQADGKIVVAGKFISVNSTARNNVARLTTGGVVDSAFNPNINGMVRTVALMRDQKLLIAGDFTTVAGQPASGNLARLNADGTLDTSFLPNLNGSARTIVERVDGKILVTGFFTSVGGQPRERLAVLNQDGSLSDEYNGLGVNGSIYNAALQDDGKVVMFGTFSSVGGVSRARMARLNAVVPAVQTVEIDDNGTTAAWTRSGSAPEVSVVEAAISTNAGATFTKLGGVPARTPTGWVLTGLKLPGNRPFEIRFRGDYPSGSFAASTSVTETKGSFLRPLPLITSPPAGQTVILGDVGVGFSIAATSAAAITGYQWRRNGAIIPGATSPSYSIPGGVTVAQAGKYTCSVTSSAGTSVSPSATLVVITPITITKQPTFQAVLPGKPATFSVSVTGSSPEYQWQKNAIDIPGATLSTYKINAAQQPGDEADYSVVVSNFAGDVPSSIAKLYVVDGAVTIPDAPASVILAMNHPSHSLMANPVSESPALHQWLKAGKPIKGANASTLTLAPIKLTDAGKYELQAANPAGRDVSDPAEMAVVDQSTRRRFIVPLNGSATLPAFAAGNGITYKWRKVGGGVINDLLPNIAGTVTKTLVLNNLQVADSGFYACTVTSVGGSMDSAQHEVVVTTLEPDILDLTLDLPQGMVGAQYGVVGAPYGFPGYPVPMDADLLRTANKFEAKGLPPGLKIDPSTGRIEGRPTRVGSYSVTIRASNGSGKAIEANDTLVVAPMTEGLVGSFVAFINPPSNTADSPFRDGGRIDLSITPAGTYSGRVLLGTKSHSFSGGKLNAGVGFNDTNVIEVKRGKLAPLTLEFDADPTTDVYTLSGKLFHGLEEADFTGWKKKWTNAVKALSYKGYYTVALMTPVPPVNDFSYPHGDGYASFTVSDLGALTVSGKLPDGASFTTSAGFVGPAGQVMIYQGLYGFTGGAVWGQLNITAAGTAPDFANSSITGSPQWKKNPTTGTSYPDGFSPLTLTAEGSKYLLPGSGLNVLGTNVAASNVGVMFTGVDLGGAVPHPDVVARLTDKNVFILPTSASGLNPGSTTLRLVPSTGLLSGGFTIPTDIDPGVDVKIVKRSGKVYGIVVRNTAAMTGKGYGFFTLPLPPADRTAPILGGKMRVN